MKRFLWLAIVVLCICGCEKNSTPKYMQVEGKIFYQEGMRGYWLSYYDFYTKDSVHRLIPQGHHSYGIYIQTDDKVIMEFDGLNAPIRAHIEDDMLVVGTDYYTQTNPDL